MQRHFEFMQFTPAQQASTALILAINMSYSPAGESIGLKRLGEKFTTPSDTNKDENLFGFHDEFNIDMLDCASSSRSEQPEGPL